MIAQTDTSSKISRPLLHLGTYKRDLPVNLARMYENALDWEHLPFLHAGSFKAISCRAAGDWGWHCDAVLPNDASVELELRLDRAQQRWVTRTLSGLGAGSEIWSYVFGLEAGGLRVVVDFFLPDLPEGAREQMLAYYTQLYAGLYDEDVALMTGRQAALEAKPKSAERVILGSLDAVNETLPIVFDLGGKRFRLVAYEGRLIAHAAVCPHRLGPLDKAEITDGTVTCPWHGYVFDIRTGKVLSGQSSELARPPRIQVNERGEVVAEAEPA